MAKQSRSNLENRAAGVRNTSALGSNSALVVGQLFLDILASVSTEFDPERAYNPGELAIWKGRNIKCFQTTIKGETPETAPGKWIDDTVDSLAKMSVEGVNLPVLASVVKSYVSQRINEVNAGGSGTTIPKATEELMNLGVDDTSFVTPKLVARVLQQLLEVILTIDPPTLDSVAKAGTAGQIGVTSQLVKLLGGLILGNIPVTSEAFKALVIDETGKVWKRDSSGTPTDPPPSTLKSFTGGVHYEAVPTVVQGSRPLLANPTSDWLIEGRGVFEKVLSNDEFTYNPTETYTKLANQYDGGTDTITALPGFIEFIPLPLPSRLRATITEGIANTAFPIRISMADKTGAADVDDFLFTLKVPVSIQTCANYFPLSEDQLNTLPIILLQEYYDGTVSMGDGISYTVRAYGSRAEAVANIGIGGAKNNFDFARASSKNCAIGDTIYSDNRLEHILDGTFYRWPVEGGFWGINLTAATATQAGSYVLIQTSPCGIITSRETITIPPTSAEPGLDFPLTLPFQFDN